jgi:hypothetical protein
MTDVAPNDLCGAVGVTDEVAAGLVGGVRIELDPYAQRGLSVHLTHSAEEDASSAAEVEEAVRGSYGGKPSHLEGPGTGAEAPPVADEMCVSKRDPLFVGSQPASRGRPWRW